ncbi:MAG: malonate decarboxylase subunit alpha [Clostridia bacterium]|nr:malonate decarboxylase subunit alpha [Clostridia bacterium]
MKIITSGEAAGLINDRAHVLFSGFGSYGAPDDILDSIAQRYAREKHPAMINAYCGVCTGDNTDRPVGFNRLSEPGLIGTLVAAHFKYARNVWNNIAENRTAAFTIPLGVMVQLFCAKAAQQPGILTKTGIHTYIDPRQDGPEANALAKQQGNRYVEVMNVDGRDYLYYHLPDPDAAIIRGTYADEKGNISIENEGISDTQLAIAMATKNAGGIVIVQVEKVVQSGVLPARSVYVPHTLVDYVVKARSPEFHMQSYASAYRSEVSGQYKMPITDIESLALDIRKVIARRALMELKPDSMVNLGIGIPSGMGSVANEEGIADRMTLSVESGPIGGVPLSGLAFGAAVNPDMIARMEDVLRYYDGGGIDLAVLGIAEVDREGNVNVSKLKGCPIGPGGFIDITQRTKTVCFVGNFTNGKRDIRVEEGKLKIFQDGTTKKFVDRVEQITFSGKYAIQSGQKVFYITERAVFQLTQDGLELVEVAPGIDIRKDVIDKMEFVPRISSDLHLMDQLLFSAGIMNVAK